MLASRLPLATGWGFFLSLATFWLLWLTINVPLSVGKHVAVGPVQFTPKIPDSDPVEKRVREKPERELPPVIGLVDPVVIPEAVAPSGRHRPDRVHYAGFGKIAGPMIGASGSDHDAEIIYRVPPTYPPRAILRNIEGWVLVQFSVAANGRVADVFVVDADPAGVFDEETIEAVRQWRYRPMVKDGRPVERVGLQTVIRFELP